MDPETLNAMNHDAYRAVLMLIQGIAVTVGLASALFMVICIVCAACDSFAEMRRSTHRQIKPVALVDETPFGSEEGVRVIRLNSLS